MVFLNTFFISFQEYKYDLLDYGKSKLIYKNGQYFMAIKKFYENKMKLLFLFFFLNSFNSNVYIIFTSYYIQQKS